MVIMMTSLFSKKSRKYFFAASFFAIFILFYFTDSRERICLEVPWVVKKSARFRVWETYIVSGWSYVEAKSIDEAGDLLEKTDPMNDFVKNKWEYVDTQWDTLQEVTE